MNQIKDEGLKKIAGGEGLEVQQLANGKYTVVGEEQLFSTEDEAKKWKADFQNVIKKATENPTEKQ